MPTEPIIKHSTKSIFSEIISFFEKAKILSWTNNLEELAPKRLSEILKWKQL